MNHKAIVIFDGGSSPGTAGEAHLWVCSGQNIGRRFALDRPEQTIGRSPSVEIPVIDERVSQQHAKIVVNEGRHYLYDLGSTNGTFVNNQPVRESQLRDGDLIQVGETVFEYLSYEERNLTINVSSNTAPPSDSTDAVPAALRAGAQQALNRARRAPDEPSGQGPTSNPSSTAVEHAESPIAVQRPAQSISTPPRNAMDHPRVEERPGYVVDDEDEEGAPGPSIADIIAKVLMVYGIFRPYWKSILACAIVGAGIWATLLIINPPMRRAVFEVNLVPGITENPIGRIGGKNVKFFKSAEQNFKSAALIRKTLIEFGEPDESISPALIASIQGRLVFGSVGPPVPNTYRGSYMAPTGEDAVRFLKKHVDVYLRSEIDKTLKVIQGQVDFLRAQLAEREKELRRTEADQLEFKRKHLDGLPQQARSHYSRLLNLNQKLADAELVSMKLNAQIAMNSRRLRSESPLVESRRLSTNAYRDDIVAVNRELIRARAEGKGEEHPDVLQLKKRKAELERLSSTASTEKEVERRRNPLYDTIQDEIRQFEVARSATYNQKAHVKKEIEELRATIEKLPELEARYAELTRTYTTTQKLYAKIYERLQLAELQYDLEKTQAAARYDIITPPNLEFVPMRKKIMKRAGIGGGAGLIFGLLLAAIRELRRRPDVVTKALTRPLR